MAGVVKKVLRASLVALIVPVVTFAVQQKNPRGSVSNARDNAYTQDSQNNAQIRRSATSVIARSVSANSRKNRPVVTARPATTKMAKTRSARSVVNNSVKSRAAMKSGMARSAVAGTKKVSGVNSRAETARATAVFNDVAKIGGGYSSCRDAYATCMDQFCANANDTYRRCYCSDRFQDFRDTADRLDKALQLLTEFQDNNLNAVDKTAAEVNAMYTATAGEAAIKKDTSASQKLLDNIGDVLSGKQSIKSQNTGLNSLGILDFSGFGGDDIWGGDSSSIFGGNSATNLAELEGKALYDGAAKQCADIVRDSCGSDSMFNLARSSYSILVSQDCNAFEKNINAKKSSVEETIRTAEKYLRDARLEEYRAHNSADVNECLTNVEKAMRQPVTCGEDYEKCMDYTGRYINTTTGEPIFSQALFGLNTLINLDGSADVLGANADFNKYLDGKRIFAETALNSCRDIADTVWYEFKRSALIQIAQAQDEKIQQIKDSCVTTIKECYDTQTGALKDIDTTKISSTDAIAAATARGICYDRVQACAALYGDPNGCKYDDKTKKLEDASSTNNKCGLKALLTFVDTVDATKVAEGCQVALTKYAHELCDPKIGSGEDMVYPMGCATMPKSELRAAMDLRMNTFCAKDLVKNDDSRTIQSLETNDATAFNLNTMNQVIKSIYDELGIAFTSGCEDEGGHWVSATEQANPLTAVLNQKFYKKYYGVTIMNTSQINDFNLAEVGWCTDENIQTLCDEISYARMEGSTCVLEDPDWYQNMCQDALGGTWVGGQCEVDYTHATVSAE